MLSLKKILNEIQQIKRFSITPDGQLINVDQHFEIIKKFPDLYRSIVNMYHSSDEAEKAIETGDIKAYEEMMNKGFIRIINFLGGTKGKEMALNWKNPPKKALDALFNYVMKEKPVKISIEDEGRNKRDYDISFDEFIGKYL